MEKVIQEFKVIETEDGFRIEIKGDKEKMKKFMRGDRGPRGFRGRRRGPFGFGMGPMMWLHGAPWCGPWDYEGEEEEGEAEES